MEKWEFIVKSILHHPEKETYTAGDAAPVFSIGGVTFGIQLCFDAPFSGTVRRDDCRTCGSDFLSPRIPPGNPEEKHASWLRHLTARAFDNSIFVIACNQVGENCNGLVFPGNSMAIDPSGEIIAKDTKPHASMLLVDLKAAALDGVRNHPMRISSRTVDRNCTINPAIPAP